MSFQHVERRLTTIDGVDYEIRIVRTLEGAMVRAFKDGEPANAISYRVAPETESDYEVHGPDSQTAIEAFVQVAINDLRLKHGI